MLLLYLKPIAACKKGFYGIYCNDPCPPGAFGTECAGRCFPECDDEDCDHVDGCSTDIEVTSKRVKSGKTSKREKKQL